LGFFNLLINPIQAFWRLLDLIKYNQSDKNISMEDQGKILVIVAAYNEEGSVGKVVEEVHAHLFQADVLVVNDGSTDLTSEIAKSKGAIVLNLPFNLGIGGTMQSGYKYPFELLS
jgi:cellulose synthase/poly-beta-1,6-N-acetylglucosamine synthase-like glycosyltransferase